MKFSREDVSEEKCRFRHRWFYIGQATRGEPRLQGRVFECTKCGYWKIEDMYGNKRVHAPREVRVVGW